MIPYKPKKGQPSPRGGVTAQGSTRVAKKHMDLNLELAESLQGLALMQKMKNVALVDVSEYTQPNEPV